MSSELCARDLPSKRLLGKGLTSVGYETELKGERFARLDFIGVPSSTFQKEATVVAGLEEHKNVVRAHDWVVDKTSCSLVFEYMEDDLLGLIQKRKESQGSEPSHSQPFEVAEALDIILQIARGMKFLHEHNILHGDLKTKNILVTCMKDEERDTLLLVKVADYGLVRTKRKSMSFVSRHARKLDVVRWKAPETLEKVLSEYKDETSSESDSNADNECRGSPDSVLLRGDVYSFALTCSQILTGEDPYPNLNWKELGVRIVSGTLRPKLPAMSPPLLNGLLVLCWSKASAQRPAFSIICETLEQILHNLQTPTTEDIQTISLEPERVYTSTCAGKHFQKDIVKGVENFTTVGNKQLEISKRLAEDCRKYGAEGPSVRESLKRATTKYGSARKRMEKEREVLHRSLATQVAEPLRTMMHGSPLEDAHHLKQEYDRLCEVARHLKQECGRLCEVATDQVSEVNRRNTKDPHKDVDYAAKLQAAENELEEVTAAMCTMGRIATSAMGVVESQQQTTTLQKLLAMVDAEHAYFQRVTGILDQLHYDIESEVRRSSTPQTPDLASPPPASRMSVDPPEPSCHDYEAEDNVPTAHQEIVSKIFHAVATHDFEGEEEGELNILIGDEVLVRQVTSSGWSEGLCNGASGWFPSTYVEKKSRQQRKRSGSSHGSR